MISVKGLTKYYGSYCALEDISFSVSNQEIIVLMGPNGAGKTSLAKVLLGLEAPSAGTVQYSSSLSLAYLPQKIVSNNCLNINSASLFSYLAGKKLIDSQLLSSIYTFANLEKISNKKITQLSGGELRKLLIASTLARAADFIVLDEPAQDLDIDSQESLYQLLQQVRSKIAVSFLLISHDLYTVTRFADQVLCLNKHLCCFGKFAEVASSLSSIYPSLVNYKHIHDHQHHT